MSDIPHGVWAVVLLFVGQLGQFGALAAVYVTWLRERRTHLKERDNRDTANRNWMDATLRYQFALREFLLKYVKEGAIDVSRIDMSLFPQPPPLPHYNGE